MLGYLKINNEFLLPHSTSKYSSASSSTESALSQKATENSLPVAEANLAIALTAEDLRSLSVTISNMVSPSSSDTCKPSDIPSSVRKEAAAKFEVQMKQGKKDKKDEKLFPVHD